MFDRSGSLACRLMLAFRIQRQDPAGHIFCVGCLNVVGQRVGKIEGDFAHPTVAPLQEVQEVQKRHRCKSSSNAMVKGKTSPAGEERMNTMATHHGG
jgi:hypothetical protein